MVSIVSTVNNLVKPQRPGKARVKDGHRSVCMVIILKFYALLGKPPGSNLAPNRAPLGYPKVLLLEAADRSFSFRMAFQFGQNETQVVSVSNIEINIGKLAQSLVGRAFGHLALGICEWEMKNRER